MFDDWKQAWRQAVDNFHREMAEGEPGTPPRVKAMEREMTSAGGALLRLDEEIRQARHEAGRELEAADVCRRRERLARDAGDEETVRVASDFAARHAKRAAVLQRKTVVLEEERALLARELDEMRQVIARSPAAQPAPPAPDRATPPGREDAADSEFSRLEQNVQDRAVSERLDELKRRMRG